MKVFEDCLRVSQVSGPSEAQSEIKGYSDHTCLINQFHFR